MVKTDYTKSLYFAMKRLRVSMLRVGFELDKAMGITTLLNWLTRKLND